MRRVCFQFLILLGTISFGVGQENAVSCDEAEMAFTKFNDPCISRIASNNCVNLDITDSYDFEGKEFTFIWDMGDGTVLEGLNIDHCYRNPGAYQAKLNLKDPITKVIIREEAVIDIIIKGSFELTLDQLEDVRTEIEETCSYELDYPDSTYQVKGIYWDFGDGTFSCEPKTTHTYAQTGKYQRALLIKLTSAIDSLVLCATDSIEVKLSDPTAGLLVSTMNDIASDSRFLEDKPKYRLLKSDADQYTEATSLAELLGSQTLRVITFRGNLIFDSGQIDVSAEGDIKGIQNRISERTIQLSEGAPLKMDPIFFELDQDELSRKNKKTLKDNAELLLGLPMLKIGIGVYTSSGGSYSKSLSLSMKRADLIKTFLLESGIEENRIVIFNPNNARTLINTCISGDCDYVDEALDRRADFKFLEGNP